MIASVKSAAKNATFVLFRRLSNGNSLSLSESNSSYSLFTYKILDNLASAFYKALISARVNNGIQMNKGYWFSSQEPWNVSPMSARGCWSDHP